MGAAYFGQDVFSLGCPVECQRVVVVVLDVVHDGVDEFLDGLEDTSSNAFVGNFPKHCFTRSNQEPLVGVKWM